MFLPLRMHRHSLTSLTALKRNSSNNLRRLKQKWRISEKRAQKLVSSRKIRSWMVFTQQDTHSMHWSSVNRSNFLTSSLSHPITGSVDPSSSTDGSSAASGGLLSRFND